MKQGNKVLMALSAIALSSTAASGSAAAQGADENYEQQCAWLSQQSPAEIELFIRQNPDGACAEFAAALLAERTKPALGAGSSADQGRY